MCVLDLSLRRRTLLCELGTPVTGRAEVFRTSLHVRQEAWTQRGAESWTTMGLQEEAKRKKINMVQKKGEREKLFSTFEMLLFLK